MGISGTPKIGKCAYCGSRGPITRDHVVPLCLFAKPYPPALITVPGCPTCNVGKSTGDDFLRDFLAIDVHSSQSPVAEKLFKTTVQRSLKRNSSHLLRDILPKLRIAPLQTAVGTHIGDFPQAEFDGDRLRRTIARIVRGLYFDARRARLPDDCEIQVARPGPWQYGAVLDVFRGFHLNGPRVMGDVFWCAYAIATEEPAETLWALMFYERVLFTAATTPIGRHDQIPTEIPQS